MIHADRPITHARQLAALLGDDNGVDRAYLRVLIGQLRKKLEDNAAKPAYILTDSYIDTAFVSLSRVRSDLSQGSLPSRCMKAMKGSNIRM
jgi:hypothetical protein